jgi:hypothetical protein
MSDPIRAYARHLRQDQLCMGGSRDFFKAHGLSWNDFLENGIPADDLAATGNPMAIKVAENARAEAKGKSE